jgi:hypothetical protein
VEYVAHCGAHAAQNNMVLLPAVQLSWYLYIVQRVLAETIVSMQISRRSRCAVYRAKNPGGSSCHAAGQQAQTLPSSSDAGTRMQISLSQTCLIKLAGQQKLRSVAHLTSLMVRCSAAGTHTTPSSSNAGTSMRNTMTTDPDQDGPTARFRCWLQKAQVAHLTSLMVKAGAMARRAAFHVPSS